MSKKNKYTQKELLEFKKIINEKISRAEADLKTLKSAYSNDSDNGTEDTSPTFKAFEESSSTLSKEENMKLAESDWMAGSDVTMSDAWKTYRQALRDLPAQSGFPDVDFPTKPE